MQPYTGFNQNDNKRDFVLSATIGKSRDVSGFSSRVSRLSTQLVSGCGHNGKLHDKTIYICIPAEREYHDFSPPMEDEMKVQKKKYRHPIPENNLRCHLKSMSWCVYLGVM